MKKPIEVESVCEFEGGREPLWLFSRGHVDKAEFATAAMVQHNVDLSPGCIEHTYLRYVPVGNSGSGCYEISGPGRGAFAVTLVDLFIP